MVEGLAQYADKSEQGDEPYRIHVGENAMRQMDKTFTGRPVYVDHVDEVDVNSIGKGNPEDPQNKLKEVGYVIRSFFNPADGKHWCEFIVVGDEGRRAIERGWVLSNAYYVKKFGPGGEWHGMPYTKEVEEAEYEHLAIVESPRYQESVILSPEQFKQYNEEKLAALKMANSKPKKGEGSMFKLSFFKKEKVENAKDLNLESLSVLLPNSKKEVTITELVQNMDDLEVKKAKGEPVLANGSELVKVNDVQMSVDELVKKYSDCLAAQKMNAEDEDKEENAEDEEDLENEMADENMDNAEEEDKEENAESEIDSVDLENAEDEEEEEKPKKKNSKEIAAARKAAHDRLANAHRKTNKVEERQVLETTADRVKRGQSRYGSSK